ncbi:hypothetical protein [Cerasicoccus fimbriatus]|uniref:hypothetical protein n=1 Tax=Cerasicoccus fimbriatus TaxID=3014554 RepID=UPI0022B4090B|nr:hypothetical protein [Cerasicoccus sp. TK19100]
MNIEPEYNLNYSQVLETEIRLILSDENEDFIRKNCRLIPEVIERSSWRVRRLDTMQFLRLYTGMVHELALCSNTLGHIRDETIAGICISLRLQRCMNRILLRTKIVPRRPKSKPASKSAA